jgi:preprotein translocase subunit SecA
VLEEIYLESNIIAGMPKEDFNIEGLVNTIREFSGVELDAKKCADTDDETIKELVYKKLHFEYENKMSQLEDARRNEIERIIYLQVLDETWREHLYQMDLLKTGIGLRGYNQKDPLVEYKKESFGLFGDLVKRIKRESMRTLFMVRFKFEAPSDEEAALAKMKEKMQSDAFLDASFVHQGSATSGSDSIMPDEKKIPRNALCPCGSGKKFKQCCGKSGPKKGLLASTKE